MATTVKEALGTNATLLTSAELGGLANNAQVVSSQLGGNGVYNNTAGSGASTTTGDGYERGYLTFTPGGFFGNLPAANSSLDIYFLKSMNGGTNFEGGSASVTPARRPDLVLPMNSASSGVADNTVTMMAFLPGCPFKTLVKNDAIGQTVPTGSTLTLTPATDIGA